MRLWNHDDVVVVNVKLMEIEMWNFKIFLGFSLARYSRRTKPDVVRSESRMHVIVTHGKSFCESFIFYFFFILGSIEIETILVLPITFLILLCCMIVVVTWQWLLLLLIQSRHHFCRDELSNQESITNTPANPFLRRKGSYNFYSKQSN